jgi:hypothetical protein
MLAVLKAHGEIGALAFDPVKDRAFGATATRRPIGPSLTGSKARAKLAAVLLRLGLSTTARQAAGASFAP